MNDNGAADHKPDGGHLLRVQAPAALGWAVCWAVAVVLGLKVSVIWLGVAIIPMLGGPAWIAIANWASLSPRDREDYGHAWRWGSSGAALAIAPLALATYVAPFEVWLSDLDPADMLVAGALALLLLQILGFWTILLHGRLRRATSDKPR